MKRTCLQKKISTYDQTTCEFNSAGVLPKEQTLNPVEIQRFKSLIWRKGRFLFSIFSLLIFILAVVSTSCEDEVYVRFTANSPVYLSYDSLRMGISVKGQQELRKPGKIYFKDNLLFINELREGIHIYDNSNPEQPVYKAFLKIPGTVDMVIRGNYLYADSYVDLVVLDITNLAAPIEKQRITNAFDYLLPEYDEKYELAEIDQKKGVVVGWEIKEVRQKVNYAPIYYPVFFRENYAYDTAIKNSGNTSNTGSVTGGETFGVGGSMARFGQYGDYLFTLNGQNKLKTYKVESGWKAKLLDSLYVGWNIETMFILNETMFIGGQQGMYIYSLTNLPTVNYISQFNHFTACDPVIADEKFAYVTLRAGGGCGRSQNVLEVIDITNIKQPVLKKTYDLTGPKGLGKDGQVLFICDGDAGLKIYDASKPELQLPLLASFPSINAYDVIPVGGNLFMIGDNGFYQYEYSNLNNIKLLSQIVVSQN